MQIPTSHTHFDDVTGDVVHSLFYSFAKHFSPYSTHTSHSQSAHTCACRYPSSKPAIDPCMRRGERVMGDSIAQNAGLT